jgi:hypothetical protein
MPPHDHSQQGKSRHRRTRKDYERGLPGYHDPTAGFGGSTPARSALTLRAVLAGFGLLFCAVAAVLMIRSDLVALGVVSAVLAAVALVDLGWVIHRKRRGEPG